MGLSYALVVLLGLCSVALSKPANSYSDELVVFIDGEKLDEVKA